MCTYIGHLIKITSTTHRYVRMKIDFNTFYFSSNTSHLNRNDEQIKKTCVIFFIIILIITGRTNHKNQKYVLILNIMCNTDM